MTLKSKIHAIYLNIVRDIEPISIVNIYIGNRIWA